MRQQVTHKEGHIPPSSRNGRSSSDNTHSKLSNGSQQNGRNQFSNGGGGYNCTTDSSTPGSHINSSFYPTKTQIISGNTPTLERVTQVHTSHIQNHQHNNNLFTPKGKDFKYQNHTGKIIGFDSLITNFLLNIYQAIMGQFQYPL